jgi:hypothetical protein
VFFGLADFCVFTGFAEGGYCWCCWSAAATRFIAEAPKAPMVDKEFSPTPDVDVDKEKESTTAPKARTKDKDFVPKPMTEDGKDSAFAQSC